MCDPIGAAKFGLQLIGKGWEILEKVRGAGKQMTEVKREVKALEGILKYVQDDNQLDSVGAEVLNIPISICNDILSDMLEKLSPFCFAPGEDRALGIGKSIEAAWQEAGFQEQQMDLRYWFDQVVNTSLLVHHSQAKSRGDSWNAAMDSAVSKMKGARIPGSNSTLIDMLLSSIQKQSDSINKEVIYKIEVTSGKSTASREPPVNQSETILGSKKDLFGASADCGTFLQALQAPRWDSGFEKVQEAYSGTCSWILDKSEYKNWLKDGRPALLYVTGNMGCGKSVLCKSIVRSLQAKSASNKADVALLHYFCSGVLRPNEHISAIIRGLIDQFLGDREGLFSELQKRCRVLSRLRSEAYAKAAAEWTLDDLFSILRTAISLSQHRTIFIVVDAVDECETTGMDHFLEMLVSEASQRTFEGKDIKVIISSRHNSLISGCLSLCLNFSKVDIVYDDVKCDLDKVLDNQLGGIRHNLGLSELEVLELKSRLAEKAHGMFQWAVFAVREISISGRPRSGSVADLVLDMPNDIIKFYTRTWQKLVNAIPSRNFGFATESAANNLDFARRALAWLILADRPLSRTEMNLALSLDGVSNTRHCENLVDRSQHLQDLFGPFVEIRDIEESSNSASPSTQASIKNPRYCTVHDSAHKFLLEAACPTTAPTVASAEIALVQFSKSWGHSYLAKCCLTYLLSEESNLHWLGPQEDAGFGRWKVEQANRDAIVEALEKYPLLLYSSTMWAVHVRNFLALAPSDSNGEDAAVLWDQVTRYVDSSSQLRGCAGQVRSWSLFPERNWAYPPSPPLHTAALADFLFLTRKFAEGCRDINEKDPAGTTALMCAVAHGPREILTDDCLMIVLLLIDLGSNVDAINYGGLSALHFAASSSRLDAVKALLAHNPIIDTRSKIDGATALHDAVWCGNCDIIKLLIKSGAKLEARDDDGYTPLLVACHYQTSKVVQLLIEHNADMTATDDDGWTMQHFCAWFGRVDTVRCLIDKGVNFNVTQKDGFTPLHMAASHGYNEIVFDLVTNGARVDSKDKKGRTAVYMAASEGHYETLNVLASMGADLIELSDTGKAPIHEAATNNHPDAIKTLVRLGAPLTTLADTKKNALHFAAIFNAFEAAKALIDLGTRIGDVDDEEWTVLHFACYSGSTEIVQLVLQITSDPVVDINAVSIDGHTPLHLAQNGEIAQLLLDHGANRDAKTPINGLLALHQAARDGLDAVVNVLLKNGAEPDIVTSNKQTALHFAAVGGHQKCAKSLLNSKANANAQDDQGRTALLLATINGELDTLIVLLNFGAHVSLASDSGVQPIHTAAALGLVEATKKLLLCKACIDARDNASDTPLHFALRYDQFAVAKLLLASSPDVSTPNNQGMLPLHLAMNGDLEVVKLILDAMDRRLLNARNNRGISPLLYAATFGNVEIFDLLIRYGADLETLKGPTNRLFEFSLTDKTASILSYLIDHNEFDVRSRDDDGWTALHFTTINKSPSATKILLERHADPNARTNNGMTPLQAAISEGTTVLVEILLRSGAKLDTKADGGWNLLHVAVSLGQAEIIKLLIDAGADIQSEDTKGHTALHVAASRGQEEAARLLVDNHIKVTLDKNGWTPQMIAKSMRYTTLDNFLGKLPVISGDEKLCQNYPSRWSNDDKCPEILVLENPCSIQLIDVEVQEGQVNPSFEDGPANMFDKAYSARSDYCIPFESAEYYFEIDIEEDGGTGLISVGISTHLLSWHDMPGWGYQSFGYYGDDGHVGVGLSDRALPYAGAYAKNDTIGCGVNYEDGTAYFTKNGRYLGTAVSGIKGQVYPTVGMIYPGSRITARFGLEPPRNRKDPDPKPSVQLLARGNTATEINNEGSCSSSEVGSCRTLATSSSCSARHALAAVETQDGVPTSQEVKNIDKDGQEALSTTVKRSEDNNGADLNPPPINNNSDRPEPCREANHENSAERGLTITKIVKKRPLAHWFHRVPWLRKHDRSKQAVEGP